jgi:hypothetical protein
MILAGSSLEQEATSGEERAPRGEGRSPGRSSPLSLDLEDGSSQMSVSSLIDAHLDGEEDLPHLWLRW